MSERIKAIYQNGVLYPLAPLPLADNTQVEVIIQAIALPVDPQQRRQMVHQALVATGLSLAQQERMTNSRESPVSSDRQEELAKLFSIGHPLSELILKEREES